MTLEAALQQQGIDPNSVSPTTKAQLQNVLLQKGKEVLMLVLQILLNQNRQVLSNNSTSEAEIRAQLEAAQRQAEADAKAEADRKKRRNVIIGIVSGVVIIGGIVVYIFTKKR
jgi:hypothetical protein